MERDSDLPLNAPKWALVVLGAMLLVSMVLSLRFAMVTPYRSYGTLMSQRGPDGARATANDIGAPDERQHVNYVVRLLEGKGIPVFDPKDPQLYETYQSHQPPVFYAVAAGWAKVTGLEPEMLTQRSVKGFSTTAGVTLRAFNTVVGAAGIVGVFFLGWWGFRRVEVALGAAGFAAFLPMNLALNGAVSNDPLLIALLTWTLALVAKALTEGWSMKVAVAVGGLTALAILTKTTGVALLPVLALAALLPVEGKRDVKFPAIALGIAVPIAAPWWARNTSLYGDPLALKAFGEAFVGSAQAKTFIEGFGLPGYLLSWVGWWTARSFVGAFGYMDIWLNETGGPTGTAQNALYRLVLAGMLVLLAGYGLSFRSPEATGSRQTRWLLLLFSAVVLVLFLRFNLQYFQAQARYLLPALGPIAVAMGLGVSALTTSEGARRWTWIVPALVLLGVSGFALSKLPSEFGKRVITIEGGAPVS